MHSIGHGKCNIWSSCSSCSRSRNKRLEHIQVRQWRMVCVSPPSHCRLLFQAKLDVSFSVFFSGSFTLVVNSCMFLFCYQVCTPNGVLLETLLQYGDTTSYRYRHGRHRLDSFSMSQIWKLCIRSCCAYAQ